MHHRMHGDDGFRFGHILIRDAAYDSIPKRLRAELHERFADWLESRLGADASDEILGYHLERAHGYRVELALKDETLPKARIPRRPPLRGGRAAGTRPQ
jgi:predicted ATPase